MTEFGKNLTNDQVRDRIKQLTSHKVIKEIDLLLGLLKCRKQKFHFRIFSEMVGDN